MTGKTPGEVGGDAAPDASFTASARTSRCPSTTPLSCASSAHAPGKSLICTNVPGPAKSKPWPLSWVEIASCATNARSLTCPWTLVVVVEAELLLPFQHAMERHSASAVHVSL